MTTDNPERISINNCSYVREDAPRAKPGKRAVVVVDRGWVFVGDVEDIDGRIRLTRAIHIKRWESIGFDGMVAQPNSSKVHLKKVPDVDMPKDAELFRIPVGDDWGL